VGANTNDHKSSTIYRTLLTELDIHPVLIDIGASVASPDVWGPIAGDSVYVGFDPDQRELKATGGDGFARSFIVKKAVTSDEGVDSLQFYFTKLPTCSSVLKPDTQSLSDYLISDFFTIERKGHVPAITLNALVDQLGLDRVDWVKTDSQGTDLRLIESLRPNLLQRVLAVDVEPGLIDAYQGEDLFIDAHRQLTGKGFWLSRLDVQGTAKMRRATFDRVRTLCNDIDLGGMVQAIRVTPGWVNARYLRTTGWLADMNADKGAYTLLWIFARLDEQVGFALDVVVAYEERFGQDRWSTLMQQDCLRALPLARSARGSWGSLIRRCVPGWLKRRISRLRQVG
jgi:FkbM family methyltransferase